MLINSLGKAWRIFATGLCFTVFGIGGIVLTLLVFPLQRCIEPSALKQKQKARITVHYTFKFFVALMHYTGAIHFSVHDRARFKQLKGQLVLANHPSLIDVVVLISVIKNADCVVKAHLFKNPFMRGVIKGTGYISNEDPQELLEECAASLSSGHNLIIFPEGTRTTPNEPLKFKRGAANIATRCRAPITTVMISMKPSTLTKDTPWYKVAPTKAHFMMRFANQQFTYTDSFKGEQPAMQARQLTRDLQHYFTEELRQL
ncbi:1-acyl-sn-glycerol-3-phosphate acyltransferase [Pseudoalteromonas sp. CO302Y]|jgi:1-acyl-sn-glycerol-3-phosphate acyltransferase|uniref:lysophospholipid acyltransferase family protein n=1 Tax=unclassified Pseudoalteromonas TaxID=194690 RepID=UPI001023AA49|nr:1-acyl-sn-glycerol-3-phosphate acyltransferase [Pseudoalteromonas sp. CO302Y]RZG06464.1 1-acyl-sn-glycerol-3-phosphate acyltransferase [Pseudoalteromonas sp. CO133X]